MKRAAKLFPWIYGLILATCLLLLLNSITYFRYENSDDILIVKSFMGFEGGTPATFQLYQHTLLSHLLGWISSVVPGVAWFSLMQIGCLWLSVALIAGSLCTALSNRLSLAIRMGLSCIFTFVFAAFAFARINFTTTAAMLGAAAVSLLASAFSRPSFPVGRTLLSIASLLMCYMLRGQSCLAAFPFWLIAFAYLLIRFWPNAVQRRRVLLTALAGLIAFAGLYGIRAYELRDEQLQELMHFQTANAGPMDYAEDRLMSVSDEVLEEIGWTRAELELVQQWYFMDANITPEAFEKLDAALQTDETLSDRIIRTLDTLTSFYNANTRYVLCTLLLLLLACLCAIPQQKKDALLPLAALGTVLMAAALIAYLAYQGRFLSRAADCALFPAAALLCALAAARFDALNGGPKRRSALILLSVCLLITVFHAGQTTHVLSDRPDQISATREGDLEAYALENADKLILRTPNLLRDTRLLPDVSSGMPVNIMIWGDWYCRTPSWYHQLEVFGFDGHHFSAADFLNDHLLFATEQPSPPQALLTYLTESTGQPVTAIQVDTRGEIRFFRFQ